MNEIIPFKKSILFKTAISSISDINLSYDYKINDDIIEGNFDLYGSYKMTEASVNTEEFIYNIPFSIALSDRIDKNSINLELDNYNYNIKKDVLELDINLKLNYEEIEESNIENTLDNIVIENNNPIQNIEITNDSLITNIKEENEINKETLSTLTNAFIDDIDEIEYKVHIIKENETIESICNKYKITLDDAKKYNDITNLNINDKLIFPINNE